MSRDALYERLKQHNIFGRRYFYPLISQFPTYRGLESAQPGKMPMAEKITEQVICLPLFPDLDKTTIEKLVNLIL
jgi:dTDP-4-amino-4,6-dideoxygalactose transaminase